MKIARVFLLLVSAGLCSCQSGVVGEDTPASVVMTLIAQYDLTRFEFDRYYILNGLNDYGDWGGWGSYKSGNRQCWVIIDDRVFGPYDNHSFPEFAAGQRKWAFVCNDGGKFDPYFRGGEWFVQTESAIFGPYDNVVEPVVLMNYSPDGRNLMFVAERDGAYHFILNGESVYSFRGESLSAYEFAADSSAWACLQRKQDGSYFIVNGTEYGPFDDGGERGIEVKDNSTHFYSRPVDYCLGLNGGFCLLVREGDVRRMFVNGTQAGEYADVIDCISYDERQRGWLALVAPDTTTWDLCLFPDGTEKPRILASCGRDELRAVAWSRERRVFAFLKGSAGSLVLNVNGTDEPLDLPDEYRRYSVFVSRDGTNWAVTGYGTAQEPEKYSIHSRGRTRHLKLDKIGSDTVTVTINDALCGVRILDGETVTYLVNGSEFGPYYFDAASYDVTRFTDDQYDLVVSRTGENYSLNEPRDPRRGSKDKGFIKIINEKRYDLLEYQSSTTYFSLDGRLWLYTGKDGDESRLVVNGRVFPFPGGNIEVRETASGFMVLSLKDDIARIYRIE